MTHPPVNGITAISGLAIVVSTGIVLSGAVTTISSALLPGIRSSDPSRELSQLTAKHREHMENWQKQFIGRSPFFLPKPAVESPIKRDKVEPVQTRPAALPKEPPHFGVFYAVGNTIRFKQSPGSSKPIQINVGQEKRGVRVVSTEQLPWSIKVEYENTEYDVPIFQRGAEEKHFLDHAPEGDEE